MSRVNVTPVQDGQAITVAGQDALFTPFATASADLNIFNTRDGAIDLPQLKATDFLCKSLDKVTLGTGDWTHGTVVTVPADVATPPAAPHVVQDGGGNPTVLSFGAGKVLAEGDLLRCYWDLSVRPKLANIAGSPYWTVGQGHYQFPLGVDVGTSATCWLFWLEWDITSSALTNFAPLPTGSQWSANPTGSKYGSTLNSAASTTPVPHGVVRAYLASGGIVITVAPAGVETTRIYWRGVSGVGHYIRPAGAGSLTVYGLRVVCRGLYHPEVIGGINYLIHDPAQSVNQELDYGSGSLCAMHMRTD